MGEHAVTQKSTCVIATAVLLGLLTASCRRAAQPTPPEELPEGSVTNWTDKTELFMEHPPLVAGQSVQFAVHLTTLRDFQALKAGRPSIELRAADGRVTTLPGTDALRPGAFRVEGSAPAAGEYAWALVVSAPGLSDRHDLGRVRVFPNEEAARAAAKPDVEAPTISYLKEQQWSNAFATVVVSERALRDAVRAPATIAAVPGGAAVVTAPAAGRLSPGAVPEIGTVIAAGHVLGRFEPRLASLEDRASLVREVAEARAGVEAAQAERDRAERLLVERAVPARRVEDATRAFGVAQAQLDAAQSRLRQRDETLSRGGVGAGPNAFVLRAPIAGRLVEIKATPGASFEEGAELFRIVRTDRLVIQALVGVTDAAQVREISAVELELPGEADPLQVVVRRIGNPGVIDAASRALPLHIEVLNPLGRLVVGQAGTAVLYTRARQPMLVVPRAAILNESGRPIVFVMVGGESFEKRRVEVGPRDAGVVGIRSGLKPGDRVVTRGVYEVLLASSAKGLPGEGHVH
jgi:membrane fusion protein, heavy metal efflux system